VDQTLPVTQRPIYISNPDEDLLNNPSSAPVRTATVTMLTEDQMQKMSVPDLQSHCSTVGIEVKGVSDKKKLIQLILDDQSA
jgi:hypothetical protein